jgi:diguanylate cyclase (GGDEF)-like protein
VLQIFARRLLASVRETDAVGRLGGDEFALLLHTTLDHAQALAAALTDSLSQPYEIRGALVHVSASTGVARCAGPGTTAAALMDAADAAMYRAKAGGKRGFAVSSAGEL